MEHENGNWEILTAGEKRAERRERVWGAAALPRLVITPVDRITSECVIEGSVREREETVAGISTGRCLRGLKWYWGLPLCEILGALLPSRVLSEWQARAVCCPIYLACQG